jgi:membrane associated rhomboid family serine protease
MIPYDLNQWGIIPRTVEGVPGIFTWIFLHGDLNHIFFNTIGLVILIPQIFSMHEEEHGVDVIFGISILAGFINWVIGTYGNHIGASGLIYGLASYGLVGSFKQRNVVSALYSLGIMLAFGSNLITGMIPVENAVSWTGHLSGAIAGVILALRIGFNGYRPTKKSISTNTWFNSP